MPGGLILPQADALVGATGADFRIGGPSAFYSPSHDYVQVPRPDAFHEPVNWHRTAFHELSHWVGHSSRLDRDQSGGFGSVQYGKEELIALSGQSAPSVRLDRLRVGKEWFSTCRSCGSPYHKKKKTQK